MHGNDDFFALFRSSSAECSEATRRVSRQMSGKVDLVNLNCEPTFALKIPSVMRGNLWAIHGLVCCLGEGFTLLPSGVLPSERLRIIHSVEKLHYRIAVLNKHRANGNFRPTAGQALPRKWLWDECKRERYIDRMKRRMTTNSNLQFMV